MNREATDLAGVRHVNYDTHGSTNTEPLALARAGERAPLSRSARTQSPGHGPRGSRCVSPAGNLDAALLLSDPSPPAQATQLSLVTALAAHDAITACAPQVGPDLKVKWPNDRLVEKAKVGGILIEGESAP